MQMQTSMQVGRRIAGPQGPPCTLGRRLKAGRRVLLRAQEASTVVPTSSVQETPTAGSGSARVTVTLKQPVGIVFSQKPSGGPVFVDELVAGGAAEKTAKVAVGDILSQCSAVVLKSGTEGKYESVGHGERLYDNWERIEYNCEGQEFKSVMGALKSNNPRWGIFDVTMTFRKP